MNFKKHSTTILTVIGSVGVIATAAVAVKETPKALLLIEQMDDEPSKVDIVKETWKCYIPAALVGASTIACIFAANGLNKRKQAALISAYTMLDSAYKEYQAKTKELLGEDGEFKIRKAIAEDKNDETDDPDSHKGKLRFYDYFSGEYFYRTMEELIDAEYQINRKFAIRGYVTIGDWYDLIGVQPDSFNDVLGWSFDENSTDCRWIDFEHELTKMEDGYDCYIVHMVCPPYADFMDYC